jgi:hypothetical protein
MREVEHALEGLQVSKNKGSMVMSFKKGSMVRDEFEDDDGVEMT